MLHNKALSPKHIMYYRPSEQEQLNDTLSDSDSEEESSHWHYPPTLSFIRRTTIVFKFTNLARIVIIIIMNGRPFAECWCVIRWYVTHNLCNYRQWAPTCIEMCVHWLHGLVYDFCSIFFFVKSLFKESLCVTVYKGRYIVNGIVSPSPFSNRFL